MDAEGGGLENLDLVGVWAKGLKLQITEGRGPKILKFFWMS